MCLPAYAFELIIYFSLSVFNSLKNALCEHENNGYKKGWIAKPDFCSLVVRPIIEKKLRLPTFSSYFEDDKEVKNQLVNLTSVIRPIVEKTNCDHYGASQYYLQEDNKGKYCLSEASLLASARAESNIERAQYRSRGSFSRFLAGTRKRQRKIENETSPRISKGCRVGKATSGVVFIFVLPAACPPNLLTAQTINANDVEVKV